MFLVCLPPRPINWRLCLSSRPSVCWLLCRVVAPPHLFVFASDFPPSCTVSVLLVGCCVSLLRCVARVPGACAAAAHLFMPAPRLSRPPSWHSFSPHNTPCVTVPRFGMYNLMVIVEGKAPCSHPPRDSTPSRAPRWDGRGSRPMHRILHCIRCALGGGDVDTLDRHPRASVKMQ
jgi:hypothetical protein